MTTTKIFNLTAILFLSLCLFASCEKSELESLNYSLDDTLYSEAYHGDKEHSRHKEERCFQLVFPVSVSFPDGNAVMFDSREDLRSGLKAWKADNPTAEERPEFDFPLEVTLDDGNSQTVDSQDALQALKEACSEGKENEGSRRRKCFQLVFPVNLVLPGGEVIAVTDRAAFRSTIKDWKEDNPTADERPELGFPVDVEYRDGEVITVSSAEEMKTLKQACRQRGEKEKKNCFDLVFPVSLQFPDGSTQAVDSQKALRQELRNWARSTEDRTVKPALVFPLEVELEDGSILTIDSKETLEELKGDCD